MNRTRPVDTSRSPKAAFWRDALRLMLALLAVWLVASYGAGVLVRSVLDQITLAGAPLGSWFAKQGVVYLFLTLIAIFCMRLSALEKKHGESEFSHGSAEGAPSAEV